MTDENIPFIDFMNMTDDLLQEKYCISANDAGLDADTIAECQESGWEPEQIVDWYGTKHGLTLREDWNPAKAAALMQRYITEESHGS